MDKKKVQTWRKKCNIGQKYVTQKVKNWGKKVAILDKKEKEKEKKCDIGQIFGTKFFREINCKSSLQKAWPDNC